MLPVLNILDMLIVGAVFVLISAIRMICCAENAFLAFRVAETLKTLSSWPATLEETTSRDSPAASATVMGEAATLVAPLCCSAEGG